MSVQKLLREEGREEFRNVKDDEDMSTPQEKALARQFYAFPDPENPDFSNTYDFMM
ncbi:hypothetical protein VE02_08612 [Pseudogymnoascus sp. 03VT05]|nr:hypothetical protein VE02_08612 [Pseudogymnoascus sp. 03VT05]